MTQSFLEALNSEKNPCNVHLKHKYVSKQAVRLVAAITAKAREDSGLINMGCLGLTLMLMGFPKNVLQLKALVFRGRRKKKTLEGLYPI